MFRFFFHSTALLKQFDLLLLILFFIIISLNIYYNELYTCTIASGRMAMYGASVTVCLRRRMSVYLVSHNKKWSETRLKLYLFTSSLSTTPLIFCLLKKLLFFEPRPACCSTVKCLSAHVITNLISLLFLYSFNFWTLFSSIFRSRNDHLLLSFVSFQRPPTWCRRWLLLHQ